MSFDPTHPRIQRSRDELHSLLERAEIILRDGEASNEEMARAEAVTVFYRWLVGADHRTPL